MIITLLSDFGLQDGYVAQVKGLLLQHSFVDHIIDITHNIPPFDTQAAAYILKDSFTCFPKKTIHIVLLDLLHQLPAKAWILELHDQWVVTADNQFLSLFLTEKEKETIKVYELPVAATAYFDWMASVAKIIGKLYGHPLLIQEYPIVHLPENKQLLHSNTTPKTMECKVLHIDTYGNLIFSITKDMFESVRNGRRFKITLRNNHTSISNIVAHYSDVEENDVLARFNQSGYLEIAVRNGDAAALFGYKMFQKEHVYYTTINVAFYDH